MGWIARPVRWLLGSSRRRRRWLYACYLAVWPVARLLAFLYRRIVVRHTRMVAIVGSFGKTTTSHAIAAGLLGPGVYGPPGNYKTSVAQQLLSSRRGDPYQVFEVGIDGFGQMAQAAAMIAPNVAVVTGIGSEHSRTFGTLSATRREKCRMVEALTANGVAVLNGDDPNVMWMAGRTRGRVVTFGMGPQNDVRASEVELDWPRGMEFTLRVHGTGRRARTALIGRHMVRPVLAAAAVAYAEDLDLDGVLARVAQLQPQPGRMQPVVLANGAVVLRDDFKSAVETAYAALDTLEEIPANRKIVVLGDISEPPGKRRVVHRAIGARVAEVADMAVFIGEGRRAYASGAAAAGMSPEDMYRPGYDVLAAVEHLKATVRPGDVVLIKARLALKFERIALALQGRPVTCGIQNCPRLARPCARCAMLTRNWAGPQTSRG